MAATVRDHETSHHDDPHWDSFKLVELLALLVDSGYTDS